MNTYNQKTALLELLQVKGISDQRVLHAISEIPRELFIPKELQPYAYEDRALAIEAKQTISQPYIVAFMTQTLLEHFPVKKVLELGTGSGYQAAILAKLIDHVYTVERIKELYEQAKQRFKKLKLNNVTAKHDDGSSGFPEYQPYDGIIVTACLSEIPEQLLQQLNSPGRLIAPVQIDAYRQILQIVDRQDNQFVTRNLFDVSFVPFLSGKV